MMQRFIKKINSRASLRLVVAALIVTLGGVLAFGVFSSRAMAGPGQPFGGQITYVFVCNCSGNYAIYFQDLTISPPITLPLIYQPGVTILYPYYKITSIGSWILGTWQGGGSCRYYVGKGCATLPTQGTMYMVGTSK